MITGIFSRKGKIMEAIKLPKKYRDICEEIKNGSYESLSKLEAFEKKFPHQNLALRAGVEFFDRKYEEAVSHTLLLMPFWDEWYYSNVANEYMMAMCFAAKKIGREAEVIQALQEEQSRLMEAEEEKCLKGSCQRYNYCAILLNYMQRDILPESRSKNYQPPKVPKTASELIAEGKLNPEKDFDKMKLLNLLFMKGSPEDTVDYYERIKDLNLGELYYEQASICYRYLGQKEKVLEVIERWAKSKLWDVASPTQVRPMSFFMYPLMHEYLENEESLKRIREAIFG